LIENAISFVHSDCHADRRCDFDLFFAARFAVSCLQSTSAFPFG
jgi:hypothetical protein